MGKEKDRRNPGILSEDDDEKSTSSAELTRYEHFGIHASVIETLTEYFRAYGLEIVLDQDDRPYGVFVSFPDKSEIHVTGGKFGSAVGFHFPVEMPRFQFNETSLQALKKMFQVIGKFVGHGYVDIQRAVLPDNPTEMVAMSKRVNTNDVNLVMEEVERMMGLLGHVPHRRKPRKKRKK